MPHEYVRALRRRAVEILQFVSDRITARAETIRNLPSPEVESPGKRAEKTVGGERVNPTGESIVGPYLETVVAMWKAGGNHRTIHRKLVEMGFEGSANAIYQYILKLKKESPDIMEREKQAKRPGWADGFDLNKAESFPNVTLESVQRDEVYAEVLKQARDTRPEDKRSEKASLEGSGAKAKTLKGSRSASAKRSPLPPYILDLMYGPEEAGADDEPIQEKKSRR